MGATPDDASLASAERSLLDALFSEQGCDDPHSMLRSSPIRGADPKVQCANARITGQVLPPTE
jgi:hypothetical protein